MLSDRPKGRLLNSKNTTLPRANANCRQKQALYVPIIIVAPGTCPIVRVSVDEARSQPRRASSILKTAPRRQPCVVGLGVDVAIARLGTVPGAGTKAVATRIPQTGLTFVDVPTASEHLAGDFIYVAIGPTMRSDSSASADIL